MGDVDWKYYRATHTRMDTMNPVLPAQMDRLVEALALPPGSRVLDIACGKGTLLLQLQDRYGIVGDGVDLSPYFIEDARQRAQGRPGTGGIQFHHMDGAEFEPSGPYFLSCCVGATWVWGGLSGTLKALSATTRDDGLILVGEPFFRSPPPAEYLAAADPEMGTYGPLGAVIDKAREAGLRPVYLLETGREGFDHYIQMYQVSLRAHSRGNPGDPDVPRFQERFDRELAMYLRWERDLLAWGLFLFEKTR
jgi:SAM-dependent methyltransferase